MIGMFSLQCCDVTFPIDAFAYRGDVMSAISADVRAIAKSCAFVPIRDICMENAFDKYLVMSRFCCGIANEVANENVWRTGSSEGGISLR